MWQFQGVCCCLLLYLHKEQGTTRICIHTKFLFFLKNKELPKFLFFCTDVIIMRPLSARSRQVGRALLYRLYRASTHPLRRVVFLCALLFSYYTVLLKFTAWRKSGQVHAHTLLFTQQYTLLTRVHNHTFCFYCSCCVRTVGVHVFSRFFEVFYVSTS